VVVSFLFNFTQIFFTPMAILEVQNVTKRFGSHLANNNISVSIEPGAIFGLLGPNGAGKTTLIRMITGIFYPDSGNVIFKGNAFDADRDIKNIGYMPEERGLYKKMKVGEHAIYLAQLKGLSASDAKQKVKYWFEKFEMQSWWGKKVQDLSKGMGQKLQFVSTILHEPELIILDEPFSGLDPVNSNLIKDEIFRLAKNGSTIIFSTHRMEQVEEICNQIILVNKGEKILDGTVKDVKQQFKENIFSVNLDESLSYEDPNLFSTVSNSEGHILLKLNEGTHKNDVLQYFIGKGASVAQFSEVLPSLNEIFIRQVEGTPTARQFN
jgi:ABC-2 type transport system ATP-binding protein